MSSDYELFRGKCREMSEELVYKDPTLTLTRGWYHCPMWGKQPHWWVTDANGAIIDPTARQFPSKGHGEYEEYDGYIECEQCGKRVHEDIAFFDGNHALCGNMMNSEPIVPILLPCPFCGSTDIGYVTNDDYEFIMCDGCGAGVSRADSMPERSPLEVWNMRSNYVLTIPD